MDANKLDKNIFRNKYLNYGYIFSVSLLSLIFIFNIVFGSFENYIGNLKISPKSIKVVFIGVIIITYIVLVTPSFRILGENKILTRTPPRGDRGTRGNRGKVGDSAACKECGDDLCYKKMMFNITQTINFWRQQNGMELLNENYIIDNEYIKDKIKKHCKSKNFKKLLTKYGSNNKRAVSDDPNVPICPKEISDLGENGCGAYDYLFKMWSIWILIILRYKNGMFFLESPGLKEADFAGLIEMEDSFKIGSVVEKQDNPMNTYIIIDNTEFPFFKIKNDTTKIVENEVYINKLKSSDNPSLSGLQNESWDNMFDSSGNTVKEKIIKVKKPHLDILKNEYNIEGISKEFIKKIGDVPYGGMISPFDEIKKYDSWLWGSDPASRPQFVIETQEENKVCLDCVNSKLCSSTKKFGGIKVKFTNSYKLLANLEKFSSEESGEFIKPFSKLYRSDFEESRKKYHKLPFSIFRAQSYTDTAEPHPYFKTYRPVGDVIIHNESIIVGSDDTDKQKCRPSEGGYDGELGETIVGKNKKSAVPSSSGDTDNLPFDYKNNNHIYTMLVSGDTKPPLGFQLKKSYNKEVGINKNIEGISIWEPIPEEGYAALGYVIDTRTFNKDLNPQPPRDIIATVPKQALKDLFVTKSNQSFMDYKLTNINTFGENRFFNVEDIEFPDSVKENYKFSKKFINSKEQTYSGVLCQKRPKQREEINVEGLAKLSNHEVINSEFKNKKYSIQKIFDNNNE